MLKEQLKDVQARVKGACLRAGRDPREVTLIAVSKTKPASMLLEAYEEGVRDFGENKVQEILEKQPVLPEDIRWHMIGHLQRNKVKQVIDKAVLIHSVDSVRLAKQIEEECAKKEICVDILLEVNVAREESKYGFLLEEVMDAAKEISKFPHVHIRGLMTIAPLSNFPKKIEKYLKNYLNFMLTRHGKTLIMLVWISYQWECPVIMKWQSKRGLRWFV